ncbi:MAG: helix-turn-helix transcriptional regulator [Lawsonibacter sp.]|nr:helix-turn-helix transcriptional regulator [Lawsonibacter sp.]
MALKYDKLFSLLQAKGHSATYWLRQNGLHAATVNKLRKNERINTDTIETLCRLLNCKPGDLMEYIPDEK